jgi:hypothetical protein
MSYMVNNCIFLTTVPITIWTVVDKNKLNKKEADLLASFLYIKLIAF